MCSSCAPTASATWCCPVPAVRAVAASGRPVTMLCSPTGAPAAERLPGVDDVVVATLPWISPTPEPASRDALTALVEMLARVGADEAVILTSSHQSPLPAALVLRLAGVARIGGISVDYPGSLLDVALRDDDDRHEVARVARARRGDGLPAGARRPRHAAAGAARRAAPAFRHRAVRRRPPRCLGTGAAHGRRIAGLGWSRSSGATACARSSPADPKKRALTASVAERASARGRLGRRARPCRSPRSARGGRRGRGGQHRTRAPGRGRRHSGRVDLPADRPGLAMEAVGRSPCPARRPGHRVRGLSVAALPAAGADLRRPHRRERCARRRARSPTGSRDGSGRMKILVWHVHGSYMTALVQGGHEYLVPTTPDRGPDGRGRAQTFDWPTTCAGDRRTERSRRRHRRRHPATAAGAHRTRAEMARRPPARTRHPGRLSRAQHAARTRGIGGAPRRRSSRRPDRPRHPHQRAVLGHGNDTDQGDRARDRRSRLCGTPAIRPGWPWSSTIRSAAAASSAPISSPASPRSRRSTSSASTRLRSGAVTT